MNGRHLRPDHPSSRSAKTRSPSTARRTMVPIGSNFGRLAAYDYHRRPKRDRRLARRWRLQEIIARTPYPRINPLRARLRENGGDVLAISIMPYGLVVPDVL